MNPDGTDLVNLTNNPAQDWFSATSPDGAQIAFCSGRDGYKGDVFIMDVDGSNQTNLTNAPSTYDCEPEWYEDGNHILFV